MYIAGKSGLWLRVLSTNEGSTMKIYSHAPIVNYLLDSIIYTVQQSFCIGGETRGGGLDSSLALSRLFEMFPKPKP